ncbi:DEAD/DEAH box helicase [Streptomyces sp. KL116D]|uniref:DEAD/DEAH box helicase n=1 Tax=Streptomyces sp. KL116D TaxID=3045152 RepID=UPI003557A52B
MGRSEREAVARGARLHTAARSLLSDHERAVRAARDALAPILDEAVAGTLDVMPVARLQEATEGRLRLDAVERAGLTTVRQVLEAGPGRLQQIPGVGRVTSTQLLGAARRLADAVHDSVAVHIDVDRPEPRTTELVRALHVLVEAGPDARRAVEAAGALDRRLGPLLGAAGPAAGRLRMLVTGRAGRARALAAVDGVREVVGEAERAGTEGLLAQASVDLLRGPAPDVAAWVDFELRSAEYYGLLGEISGRAPDTAAVEGFLPEGIAGQVHGQHLVDDRLKVSLRGYQAFGARFALARRRVVLGDEMGLGKTVQAIAVLTHLVAEGQSHFMVVCPASVLVNWTREIEARSALRAVPLHGPGRADAFADWKGRGGVAVTTFDALRGFPVPGGGELGMLVVDEAHSVKNPLTLRARAVAEWAARCERVLLMTGTPMENRVAEFRSLVRLLDPGLADRLDGDAGLAGSVAFRKAVAPVYLRRNQEDVLTELPSLQHTDEWEEPSERDESAYRDAVRAGNFMAMRRAAYAHPEGSAKLRRLRDLVREAAENGLKVVVFSYFRDVLDAVHGALGAGADGPVFGPLTGAVPPARRQALVDAFSAAAGPAVLVAQIQAAGLGLNIQAASVVILCEPQIKPTLEHQAVARAHRIGQLRPVRVHRLLAPGGVDERMVRILTDKARLFDAYARRSAVAEATPDALDVSDTDLARRIVEEEQARLGLADGPPGPATGHAPQSPPAPAHEQPPS